LFINTSDNVNFAQVAAQHVERGLGYQLIAGAHWLAETRFFNRGEVGQRAGRVARNQSEHSGHLRHRFENEHAGHDGMAGKVTLKMLFVGRHILHADAAMSRFQFDNAIDQQKRIAMRQNLADFLVAQRASRAPEKEFSAFARADSWGSLRMLHFCSTRRCSGSDGLSSRFRRPPCSLVLHAPALLRLHYNLSGV
jgi:hypothetical protein